MSRPRKCRKIGFCPKASFYKPAGIPLRMLQEIILNPDEIEVIRLIDVEELDQAGAAEKLGVSRITIQRIYKSARRKIAKALIEGRALRFDNQTRGCGCRLCESNFKKGGDLNAT